jgi:hypothetical protein
MTDPDKRSIKDERYHRDAALRHVECTEPRRTHAEWLAHFKEVFDGEYIVTAPEAPGAQWRAVPTFGGSALFEWTPTELLAEMQYKRGLRDADKTDES